MDYLNHNDVPAYLKMSWREGKLSDAEFERMARGALRKLNIASTDEELLEAGQGEQTKQDSLRACYS